MSSASLRKGSPSVRGTTNWNCAPWPCIIVTICMNYLKQEVLVRNAELTSYHQQEVFGKGQKERGNSSPYVLLTSQNPPHWSPSWHTGNQEGQRVRVVGQRQLETNPIVIKPETSSYGAEQSSGVLFLSCSAPGTPFPIKSLALSAWVSPQTIHFQVLDKSPLSGPERGPPSCNTSGALTVHFEVSRAPCHQ